MSQRESTPEQRTIPSYAKIAEQTFGTMWQEAQPADWALVVYNLREKLNAPRSDIAPKLCADCGCELECVKHGCAKKYAEHRDAVLTNEQLSDIEDAAVEAANKMIGTFDSGAYYDEFRAGLSRALKGNATPQVVKDAALCASGQNSSPASPQPAESASAAPFVATGEFGPIGETTPAIIQEWTPPAQRCVGVPSTKTPEGHKARHVELHKALDELFADYITHHPDETEFTRMPLLRLLKWSNEQQHSPTEQITVSSGERPGE